MLWISLVTLAWFLTISFIAIIPFFVFLIPQNKKIVKTLSSDSSSNSNEQKKSVKNMQQHTTQKVTNYLQEPKTEKTSPPMIVPIEKGKEGTMICLQNRASSSIHQDAEEEVIEMIDVENEKEKDNR